ncbi:hypothetical protein DRN62_00365 [Nanoarchaeota archaeon]|nr:MAG: hypothetical protein DRN62_00365 [Nanoarchaeota archaeon]
MKAKKFVKKIVALAGSAAMVGATVGGAMAALSDLPSPFITNGIFDAYVVVGANAGISDVVAAIELAAAFAQKATSGGAGVVTFEKNTTAGVLTSGSLTDGAGIKSVLNGVTFTPATDGFDWLENKTVTKDYGNGTIVYLKEEEKLGITDGTGQTDAKGNLIFYGYGIIYNVTFNQTVPEGTSGISWLGDTYELVSSSSTEVILGQIEETTLKLGEEVTVGQATITATDIDSVLNEVYLVIKDENGNIVKEDWFAQNEEYSNETIGIKNVKVKSFHYSITKQEGTVELEIRASAVTLKDGNTTTEYGDKWEVDLSATDDGVNWIALKSRLYYPEYPNTTTLEGLTPNSEVAGPNNYWYLYHDGFKILDDGGETTIQVKDDFDGSSIWEILYVDNNDETVMIDLDSYTVTDWTEYPSGSPVSNRSAYINLQGSSWVFEVFDISGGSYAHINITKAGESTPTYSYINITSGTPYAYFNVSDVWYRIDMEPDFTPKELNLTVWNVTIDTNSLRPPKFNGAAYNLTYTNATKTVTINDAGDEDITIDLGDREVYVGTKKMAMGETLYSKWGSKTSYGSTGIVSVGVPENQRVLVISLGRKAPSQFTVNVGEYSEDIGAKVVAGGGEVVNKISPEFAYLDSELSTVDKPVILVGGPAINSLVASLGNKTLTLDEWRSGNYTGKAIIDLIENAFDGNTALVVAGYEADQTRIAARLLAKELLFGGTVLGDNWTGKDKIILDASGLNVDDYTSATVVE